MTYSPGGNAAAKIRLAKIRGEALEAVARSLGGTGNGSGIHRARHDQEQAEKRRHLALKMRPRSIIDCIMGKKD